MATGGPVLAVTIEVDIKKNQGIIKLAEVRKKGDSDKKKKKEDEKKSFAERSKEANAPYINESVNILLDWISYEKNTKLTKASN